MSTKGQFIINAIIDHLIATKDNINSLNDVCKVCKYGDRGAEDIPCVNCVMASINQFKPKNK